MTSYTVEVSRPAQRGLRRLDRGMRARALRALTGLALDPRPRQAHALFGNRAGQLSLRLSGPGGECRIVYTVNDREHRVEVVEAGTRESIY